MYALDITTKQGTITAEYRYCADAMDALDAVAPVLGYEVSTENCVEVGQYNLYEHGYLAAGTADIYRV